VHARLGQELVIGKAKAKRNGKRNDYHMNPKPEYGEGQNDDLVMCLHVEFVIEKEAQPASKTINGRGIKVGDRWGKEGRMVREGWSFGP